MKKVLIFSIIILQMLNAVNLTTNKANYKLHQPIKVSFSNLTTSNKSWIGIYHFKSSNAWENVIAWKWTGDKKNGTLIFNGLPYPGEFEARVFYNNSFKLEAKSNGFNSEVGFIPPKFPKITTDRGVYDMNQPVKVTFSNLADTKKNWIGIYPSNSSNAWENVVDWKWTGEKENGTLIFNDLPPEGEFEARAFYNNSFKLKARSEVFLKEFDNEVPQFFLNVKVEEGVKITINYENMGGNNKNWIAIYPKNSTNAWENVIVWHRLDKNDNFGESIFDASTPNCDLKHLPQGNYEVRAFYNNSFDIEAREPFSLNIPTQICTNNQ